MSFRREASTRGYPKLNDCGSLGERAGETASWAAREAHGRLSEVSGFRHGTAPTREDRVRGWRREWNSLGRGGRPSRSRASAMSVHGSVGEFPERFPSPFLFGPRGRVRSTVAWYRCCVPETGRANGRKSSVRSRNLNSPPLVHQLPGVPAEPNLRSTNHSGSVSPPFGENLNARIPSVCCRLSERRGHADRWTNRSAIHGPDGVEPTMC